MKTTKKSKVKNICPACKKIELEDVTDPRMDNGWQYECPKCGYAKLVLVETDGSTEIHEHYPPGK